MRYDFVVMGGGVYGCATAWELARRGARVAVLEARTVAAGASGGPGKRGVRACGRDPRELPLMRLAYDLWPALAGRLARRPATSAPACSTSSSASRMALTAAGRAPPPAPGRNISVASPRKSSTATPCALEPEVCDAVSGALSAPTTASRTTRPPRAAWPRPRRVWAPRSARGRRSPVWSAWVTAYGGGDGRGEHIAVGEAALLLTNAHAPGFVREQLGVTLPVWSMLPQVLLTEPLRPAAGGAPDRARAAHAGDEAGSRRAGDDLGGWHGRWDAQAQGAVIPAQVAGNLAEAAAVYPALAGVRLAESDASRPESVCVDGIPIIDRLPGAANLLVGTGWSGHGFAIALAVAKLLADWATGVGAARLFAPSPTIASYGKFEHLLRAGINLAFTPATPVAIPCRPAPAARPGRRDRAIGASPPVRRRPHSRGCGAARPRECRLSRYPTSAAPRSARPLTCPTNQSASHALQALLQLLASAGEDERQHDGALDLLGAATA